MRSVDSVFNYSGLIFFCLFAAAFCPAVSGQPIELTEQQYDLAVARFQTSTNGVSRRELTRIEDLSDGKVIRTVETVREVDASGNSRTLTRTIDTKGISESETIWIGSFRYTRDGTKWQKEDLSRGPFTGSGPPEASDVVKYLFEEVRNGPLVTFIFTQEIVFDRETGKRFETTRTHTNRYFWRQRSERTKSEGNPENIVERSSTTYDYSPGKIEIKPPIE